MTDGQDAGPQPGQEAGEAAKSVHLEASASDNAQVIQAGRDLHVRYGPDGPGARRAWGAEVVEDCPYPGLAAFAASDERWFFGREALLAELTELLSGQPASPVLLVASSGAGKSSLLQAGLIPAVDRGALPQPGSRRWPRLLFTPTAHPLAALAAQLSTLTGMSAGDVSAALALDPVRAARRVREASQVAGGAIIVVDQFEEAFALCDDEKEQALFVEALCALSEAGCLAVLSLRADFYQQASAFPRLRVALRDRQVLMGPMSETELRHAIVYPGQAAGLELESGLVELLIRDLGATTSQAGAPGYDAGRLPLLAHALRATWQQRHGHLLTVDGYLTTGGIRHAIATSAERTFGQLTEEEQKVARLLFLRLIKIGDHTDDTRRLVARGELIQDTDAETVVDAFTRARLLTRERDAVEITHEALLREWPRLRGWIDTDHAGRLVQQDIEEQATEWEAANRDASRLYRGTRLAAASTWAVQGELTTRARAFLAASVRQQRQASRWRRGVLTVLTVLTLAASFLVGVAVVQRHDAVRNANEAFFNQISAGAQNLRGANPSLAAQFDVAAYRMEPASKSIYTALIGTEAQGLATPVRFGATPFVDLRYSPGGRVLAGAGGQSIRLWNTANPQQPVSFSMSLPDVSAAVQSVDISADGHLLVAGMIGGIVQIWNIADPAHATVEASLHVPEAHGTAVTATFGPPNVLVIWVNWTLQLWDVADLAKPIYRGSLAPCLVQSWSLGQGGGHVAVGCSNGDAYLADIADSAHPRVQGSITASSDGEPVTTVVLSPDDRTLLTSAYQDDSFALWNVTRPQRPASLASPQTNFNDGVTWAAFSPDGSMLATADEDGTVQLWNVADPDGDPLGQPMNADAGPALAIAFSPNGQTIASGYADGSMRLWSIPHLLVTTLIQGDTDGLAFSPDGKVLAASSNYYGAIDLWDIGDDSRARWAGTVNACPGTTVDPIAFSPRSSVLAAGCANGSFRLWDTANPFHVTALSPPLVTGGRSSVNTVSFDKDGKLLAVSDYGGKVTLWNVTDPVHPSRVGTFSTKNTNAWTAVAVSPDGRTVAVSVGSTVHLWDVADPARPHSIGPPLTGPVQALTLLTFSPNGNLVAAGSDDHNVYLWYATGPHVGALAGGGPLVGHTDFVSGVAFSSDGQTLASSSYDQTVRLWNVASSASVTSIGEPLTGHTDYSLNVAFSPEGHTLASIGLDDTIYLWDLNVTDAITRICATTSGILTRGEWNQDLPGVPYNPPCPGPAS